MMDSIRTTARSIARTMVAAFVIAAALGAASAYAAVTPSPVNRPCRTCHESNSAGSLIPNVAFRSTIDWAACRACHWITPEAYVGGFQHQHRAGRQCSDCHGWRRQSPDYRPVVRTAAGNFSTAAFRQVSAQAMHAAHVGGSWPQQGLVDPNHCVKCHGATACSTCHVSAAAHAAHGTDPASGGTVASIAGVYAAGTPVGAARSGALRSVSMTCESAGCHSGRAYASPTCLSCHPGKTVVHTPASCAPQTSVSKCGLCHAVASGKLSPGIRPKTIPALPKK